MSNKAHLIIFVTSLFILTGKSARILGIIPTPAYSHQIAFQPIWRELSLRGHQLTVLTTVPMNDPSLTNLTEIDLHHSSFKPWQKLLDLIKSNNNSFLKSLDVFLSLLEEMTHQQFQHPDVQKLISDKKEHFDLVIAEFFVPAMFAFATRFKCPFIGVLSTDAPTYLYEAVGNPAHPVLNPDVNLPFVEELRFFQRLMSALYNVFSPIVIFDPILAMNEKVVKTQFGNEYPPLKELRKNVSLLFVNSDQIFYPVRPLIPSVIQIGGGSHRHSPQPLPKELKNLLDDATQGVIFFSLGSSLKSSDLSESIRNTLLETFAELPYLVLWKFELEVLPDKPKNVFISKWFPQQDVFRHPNIKLVITQGGQQSLEEAIYSYIPIIGMPMVNDQMNNVKRLVNRGLGLSIDYTSLDKKTLKETILEVITNPKYRNRVKELVDLAQDQPMTGLERAIWWTEYVLRHKGAPHLRSPALDLPLHQYFLLDVIGFCLVVILVVIYLVLVIIRMFYKLVQRFIFKPKEKVQ